MIPQRLAAPEPGWTLTADVVVVGSGIAGLTAALRARAVGTVLLVTKAYVDHSATRWAQGGIAAALHPLDSPEEHLRDTLVAGAGLCDEEAVRVLVTEGPSRVRELIELGAQFDMHEGELAMTREGGHLRSRVIHAKDATGAEVERALVDAVCNAPDIKLIEHALVLDLLTSADGRAAGLTLHVLGEGTVDGVGAVRARAIVLAAGGLGQVYSSTTNPSVSTGDGVALALRAGAVCADLEFVQFHPTAFHLPGGVGGQQPLITEAMRGEGAVLVDANGVRVMDGVHELGDLAPRDVVAKAMSRLMARHGVDHLYLDARGLGADKLLAHFPTIVARCRQAGVDPVVAPIPVAPAAHYASGGVLTDLDGRTTIPGLYACGEVACTGVHGANRLASNSLLEGLVFAHRIVDAIAGDAPPFADPAPDPRPVALVEPAARLDLAHAMTEGAGVLRSADSLAQTGKTLDSLARADAAEPRTESWETTNLHAVASAITAAAALRQETRGGHWREDFPEARDAWLGHVRQRLVAGRLVTEFVPAVEAR
ncbi:MAG TPA: L-aspartate oxidase [Frankiaceae bacterium]|nr:L-aspartate oxidase [Frankiaceae bacterium]